MSKRERTESSTGMYHIINRGINKESIFLNDYDKEKFLQIIEEKKGSHTVELYCYCVMSNHFHLIIRAELNELSNFMKQVLSAYAMYYNWKNSRSGYVFQGRFKSECIETEAYYWNCVRYIHQNPIKAKIVKDSLSYPYSSMKEYCSEDLKFISEKAIKMVKNHFSDISSFKHFHKKKNENNFIDIEEEVWKNQKELTKIFWKNFEKKNKNDTGKYSNSASRKAFIAELSSELKISAKKADQLLREII